MNYFRKIIDEMDGYTPGEQPQRTGGWIKLNTNENPYPPSPAVTELINNFAVDSLRLYPDPLCCELRRFIAKQNSLKMDNVIVGNGSDDILTIALRCFVSEDESAACPEPSYSLYPVLTKIQGAACLKIPLNEDFSLPDNFAEQASGAKLILIPRPNAPTGTAFNMKKMRKICTEFQGIVLIDEAYADFADSNCIELVREFPNVIISRTLSKSYSLAGIRVGYALASNQIISGMMKVKDSYNVNALSQKIAITAIDDCDYFENNIKKICASRRKLTKHLKKSGFKVIPSQANFIFTSPPDGNGKKLYESLKKKGILVRWFEGKVTGSYIRITIGTDSDIDKLIAEL